MLADRYFHACGMLFFLLWGGIWCSFILRVKFFSPVIHIAERELGCGGCTCKHSFWLELGDIGHTFSFNYAVLPYAGVYYQLSKRAAGVRYIHMGKLFYKKPKYDFCQALKVFLWSCCVNCKRLLRLAKVAHACCVKFCRCCIILFVYAGMHVRLWASWSVVLRIIWVWLPQVPYAGHVLVDTTWNCGRGLAEANCSSKPSQLHESAGHGSKFFSWWEN